MSLIFQIVAELNGADSEVLIEVKERLYLLQFGFINHIQHRCDVGLNICMVSIDNLGFIANHNSRSVTVYELVCVVLRDIIDNINISCEVN